MKFSTVSTLVVVALCSFMLAHTALGESNLMKVLKVGRKALKGWVGNCGHKCFNRAQRGQGRKGKFTWRVPYVKSQKISGNYINLDNLRLSRDKTRTVYEYDCDGADKSTGLCKDIQNPNLSNGHYCTTCSFKGTKTKMVMLGYKNNDGNRRRRIKLKITCKEKYKQWLNARIAKYTYRVEDSRSRRRRLLGKKYGDADCRL